MCSPRLYLLLLAVLLWGATVLAQAQDPPPDDAPAATLPRPDAAVLASRLADHLLAAGYQPLDDDVERNRLLSWLQAAETALWSSLRSAETTLALCRVVLAPDGEVHEITGWTQDQAAAFREARHTARLHAGIRRHLFFLQDGAATAASLPFVVFRASDGRRLLEAQYPGLLLRTQSDPEFRHWVRLPAGWHRADGGAADGWLFAHEIAPDDALLADVTDPARKPSSAAPPDMTPVPAPAEPISVHPLGFLYDGLPSASPASRMLAEEGDARLAAGRRWWTSDTRLMRSVVSGDERGVAVALSQFDLTTGLPVRLEALAVGDRVEGLERTYEGVVVQDAEGEALILPALRRQVNIPPMELIEALGLGAYPPAPDWLREEVLAVLYHTINDRRLEDPAWYGLDSYAEREGLRFYPSFIAGERGGEVISEMEPWGPSAAPLIGPPAPRDAPRLVDRWDARNRAVLAALDLPIAPEDVVTYRELLDSHQPPADGRGWWRELDRVSVPWEESPLPAGTPSAAPPP